MQEEKRAAEYVNPFIGASTNVRDAGAYHGLGKTIPGATYPFGLVQLSPNTITGGDNGSGYSDEHESIEGFAFTQMSGIGWYGDLGNFLVMPTIGPMHTNSGKLENPDAGYRSRYDKASEYARAGYYSVYLSDYRILTEATVAQRAGMLRLTAGAEIHRQVSSFEGKHLGFFAEFETTKDEVVLMKAGISFVSEENARENLETEIADWDFERVLQSNQQAWNEALSKVEVASDDEELKHIFYTALYRTMIDPRLYSDTNGEYMGGDKKIYQTGSFQKRTIFSGWDVFRSEMPLLTLIRPDVISDMLNSLITLADESGKGYLERWEFQNAYSGCMIGNPAISVLVDAYKKRIRNYDLEKAWQYAEESSRLFGNAKYGYVPGSISSTLEYAYTEWCMAELAKALGKTSEEQHYRKLAKSYQHIYDAEHRSFRPKDEKGNFLPWPEKGRLTEGYGSVESNPFQQGWFVPHDIEGLTQLMGGREKTIEELDYMFANTPTDFLWNQFYNHANEPVHHVPFLYNRLGQPWKTQYWTRFICQKAYKNEVKGLVGNENVGQMSAWYVLASIGMHPICPGDTRMELSAPLFDKVTLRLAGGKVFTIRVKGQSPQNTYIQSATLNGKPYTKCYIDYQDVVQGGVLELTLSDQPNKNWGVGE